MRIRISVGITIRIIIGGRMTTGIICIRKMGITVRITITKSITIRITILKRTMTSGLTVVGKRGRQTHGRTHNIVLRSHYRVVKTKGSMESLQNSDANTSKQ
jgi:hypothetical protein